MLLGNINAILIEYKEQLPLTNRQIFYRLVGAYGFDKTEQAYNRLCNHLTRARRAGLISFEAIRDDGTQSSAVGGLSGPAEFWEDLRESADYYHRDRSEGQRFNIELWCEAGGMLPQLSKVANPYGVSCYSTGGFSSLTVIKEIAARVLREPRPTIFLHVGDFDPSGESIYEHMAEDVGRFVSQASFQPELAVHLGVNDPQPNAAFRPDRVALTEDQVDEYGLPTAPPKRSDSRSRNWHTSTCQCEALPPDTLAKIVTDHIEDLMDMDQYWEVIDLENKEREDLQKKMNELVDEYDESEDED